MRREKKRGCGKKDRAGKKRGEESEVRGSRGERKEENSVKTAGGGGNCIKLLYTNAQSIVNKMGELQVVASLKQPDIIAITETWTDQEERSPRH